MPAALADGLVHFCGNANVGAVDVGAGREAWRHKAAQPCVFRPRVGGGVAVYGSAASMQAHDDHSGRPLWQAVPDEKFGVPHIHQGRFLCGDGHKLVSRDLKTGKVAWAFEAKSDVAYGPTATGDMVLVGPGDGGLYALDADTGALRWSINRWEYWQYLRQLYVEDGILIAGSYQEQLMGITLDNGTVLWERIAGNFLNSQHVAGGTAYFWSPTGWVYAIDTKSGNIRWRHQTTDYFGGKKVNAWASLMAELATFGPNLFALDMDNHLHILDRATGEETARLVSKERLRPFVVPLSPEKVVLGTTMGALLLCPLKG